MEVDDESDISDKDSDINSDDENGPTGGNGSLHKNVIHGVSSQGYNAVTHHTRGRTAQHHEVQVGMVTGALAGAWATSGSNKTTADKLEEDCRWKMPHESFAEKIRKPGIARDLRLENVYWIDIGALQKKHQNGRSVDLRLAMHLNLLTI